MKILTTVVPTAIALILAAPCAANAADDSAKPIAPKARIELFNGKDLAGWTFYAKDKAAAAETWTVTNGVIHCTGKPLGYLRTEQDYRDFKLTVEWRFVKVAPKADNGGVLVHIQAPDKLWPMCVQNQGKSGRQGDLFVMAGAECKEHRGQDPNTAVPMRGPSAEMPVGQWDTNVTICAGNNVKAIINGKFMNEITECTISSGKIGFQSETGEMEIRRVSIEPVNNP